MNSIFTLNDGSSLKDFLSKLENPEISSYKTNYDLKTIIEASSSYAHVSDRLDILLGIIYLYRGAMNDEEVSRVIKSDWNIEISAVKINSLCHKFKTRKMYAYMHRFYLLRNNIFLTEEQKDYVVNISSLNVDIIHAEHKSHFKKTDIVQRRDFKDLFNLVDKDDMRFMLGDLLLIKRFVYAYSISDMEIIENYIGPDNKKPKFDMQDKSKYVFESQIRFSTLVKQLSERL